METIAGDASLQFAASREYFRSGVQPSKDRPRECELIRQGGVQAAHAEARVLPSFRRCIGEFARRKVPALFILR